ncbi:MAG: adenylate/guanylate cyclase domain-containing protein [Verrucomicrobiota bacterium]
MKKLLHGVLVGLGAAAVALAVWLMGLLDVWEYSTWAWRVRSYSPRSPASGQIKVILLDQYSLDWGKNENGWSWPWPRVVYTAVLDFCQRGGAKAVAFDMLYTEPSVVDAADDEAFGAGIRRSPPFVGAIFLGSKSGEATNWPAQVPGTGVTFENLDAWLDGARRADVVAPRAAFPIPDVATNAAMLANVSDQPDKDGIFRRATLFRLFDSRAVPSIGLAAYLVAERAAGRPVPLALRKGWLEIGGKSVPIDDSGRAILCFRGTNGTHEAYNAASVIQSELRLQAGEKPVLDPAVFRDAYVFFGSSAPGLLDLRPSPISKVYPGVEIHATSLDNLLTRLFLRDAPGAAVIPATLILALLAGLLVTLSRKAWQSVVAFVVCLPVPIILGFLGYAAGYWWPIVVGEIAVGLALVGGEVVNYATEGRQKAFIKHAFGFYVGSDVMEQMLADPSRLRLGGEKRELTIFFSDIEKFSSFSEKLDPATLTTLLNDYLSDMGALIKEEGGYLDKYIGDAIVAFWNAPVDQADHAIRAVRAGLRCQCKLAERREEFRQRTGATVKARIGLNTGDVNVGNMGSRERFNYTVLGDAANLASRLEGANKAFGTYFMVSEATWAKIGGEFVGRELGQIRVVGRHTPVRVYEPVGLKGEPVPAAVPAFEKGLSLVYASQWAEALKQFEQHADDPASRIYADRCRNLLSDPAGKWDGIWNLTEK